MKVERRDILLCLSSTFMLVFHVMEVGSLFEMQTSVRLHSITFVKGADSPHKELNLLYEVIQISICFVVLEFQFFISYSMLHELHTWVTQIMRLQFSFTFKVEVGYRITNHNMWQLMHSETYFQQIPDLNLIQVTSQCYCAFLWFPLNFPEYCFNHNVR